MRFDVIFLYEHACSRSFPVFSPFSAHFYPPLHHNGKGSITCKEFRLSIVGDGVALFYIATAENKQPFNH